MDPIEACNNLIDIADKLGIIQTIKSKLVRQPDQALAYLVAVLEEISKIYEALDGEVSRYLALAFYDGMQQEEEDEARHVLLELQGGMAEARVAAARVTIRRGPSSARRFDVA